MSINYNSRVWGVSNLKKSLFYLRYHHLVFGLKCLEQVEGSVLDIGCGGGVLTRAFKKYRPDLDIYGADISRPSLAQARRRSRGVQYTYADVYKLPFACDSFAAVFMFDVLEHLDDPVAALEEARRVIKPGGLLCLSVPLEKSTFTIHGLLFRYFGWNAKTSIGHINLFTQNDLWALLHEGGFTIFKFKYIYQYIYQVTNVVYFMCLGLLGRGGAFSLENSWGRSRSRVVRWVWSWLAGIFALMVNVESWLWSWWPGQTILVAARKQAH